MNAVGSWGAIFHCQPIVLGNSSATTGTARANTISRQPGPVALFGFFANESLTFYWIALPIFGFLVSGMHAGYAVYFPELFPSRLRSTGVGHCQDLAIDESIAGDEQNRMRRGGI